MKVSKSSLPCFLLVLLGARPFIGSASEGFTTYNPLFHSRDAVLWLTQSRDLGASCEDSKKALGRQFKKAVSAHKPLSAAAHLEAAWGPWPEDDLEWVTDCDSFPCKIKLDRAEVEELAAKAEESRQTAWFAQVFLRVTNYLKSGVRRSYEFEGAIIDPWAFAKQEFLIKGPLAERLSSPFKGTSAQTVARRFDFSKKKNDMKPIRQVVDVQFDSVSQGALLKIRDVYTAHYFDSWGELYFVDCLQKKYGSALVLELDLLKAKDLISRLSRSSMRSAVEEQGHLFLSKQALEFENELKK